jgi:hypothetical protein
LSASAEGQPGPEGASGTARITLNKQAGTACWAFIYSGIDTPLTALVHKGAAGEDGPAVIALGDKFDSKGCEIVPVATLYEVSANPSAYYVNIHTKNYLNGAIRGQLRSAF